jgi:hypothetical protein
MPSELQRVAEQLLACLNEAPRAVGYLHDRARKCRDAAAWIGSTSNNPSARLAATQLDEAARRCEEAAPLLVSGGGSSEAMGGADGERYSNRRAKR